MFLDELIPEKSLVSHGHLGLPAPFRGRSPAMTTCASFAAFTKQISMRK